MFARMHIRALQYCLVMRCAWKLIFHYRVDPIFISNALYDCVRMIRQSKHDYAV
jgi:hypothetical protein